MLTRIFPVEKILVSLKNLRLVNRRQPKRHVCAGGGKHHVLWIELNTLYRPRVVGIQDAYFVASISVPYMHAAISGTAEDEL